MASQSNSFITVGWQPRPTTGFVYSIHASTLGEIVDVDLAGIERLHKLLLVLNDIDSVPTTSETPADFRALSRVVSVNLRLEIGRLVGEPNGEIAVVRSEDHIEAHTLLDIGNIIRGLIKTTPSREHDLLSSTIDEVLNDANQAITTDSSRALAARLDELRAIVETVLDVWADHDLHYTLAQVQNSFGIMWPTLRAVERGVYDLMESAVSHGSGRAVLNALFEFTFGLMRVSFEHRDFYIFKLANDLHVSMVRLAVHSQPGPIKEAVRTWSWLHLAEMLWLVPPGRTVLTSDDVDWVSDAADASALLVGTLTAISRSAIESRDTELFASLLRGTRQRLDHFADSLSEQNKMSSTDDDTQSEVEAKRLEAVTRISSLFAGAVFIAGAWAVRRVSDRTTPKPEGQKMIQEAIDTFGTTENMVRTAVDLLGLRWSRDLDRQLIGGNWWLFDIPEGDVHTIDSDSDLVMFFGQALMRLQPISVNAMLNSVLGLQGESARSQALRGFANTVRNGIERAGAFADDLDLPPRLISRMRSLLLEISDTFENKAKELEKDEIIRQELDQVKINAFKAGFLEHWRTAKSIRQLYVRADRLEQTHRTGQDTAVQIPMNYRLSRDTFVLEQNAIWPDFARDFASSISDAESDYIFNRLISIHEPRAVARLELANTLVRYISGMESSDTRAIILSHRFDIVLDFDSNPHFVSGYSISGAEFAERFGPGYEGMLMGVPVIVVEAKHPQIVLLVDFNQAGLYQQLVRPEISPDTFPFQLEVEDFTEEQILNFTREAKDDPNWTRDVDSAEDDPDWRNAAAQLRMLVREWVNLELPAGADSVHIFEIRE